MFDIGAAIDKIGTVRREGQITKVGHHIHTVKRLNINIDIAGNDPWPATEMQFPHHAAPRLATAMIFQSSADACSPGTIQRIK